MSYENLLTAFKQRLGEKLLSSVWAYGELTLEVTTADIVPSCQLMRDEFGFEELVDLCGVDYSAYGKTDWQTDASGRGFSRGVAREDYRLQTTYAPRSRFAVVYHLLSVQHNRRLRLRAFAEGEPPRIDSVTSVWNSANWYEREAFDLYGILFEGHTDLRRLLTDYGFIGHPFRKDFPVSGHVEMRYDPEKERVVYEPVSIEPRTLVPRVGR